MCACMWYVMFLIQYSETIAGVNWVAGQHKPGDKSIIK